MHKQANIIDLWTIHFATQQFSLTQPRTEPPKVNCIKLQAEKNDAHHAHGSLLPYESKTTHQRTFCKLAAHPQSTDETEDDTMTMRLKYLMQ